MDRTVRQIADFQMPVNGPQLVPAMGTMPTKTVGEAKDAFVKMVKGDGVNLSNGKDNYVSEPTEVVIKGAGNTASDYLDDIIVNGKVDSAKMNKLKNAIQNNTFSVDELSEIRKKMTEIGITNEYDEALIKIDFGRYLRGLIGDPPAAMVNPHSHHILFEKGLGDAQQKLVQEGQEILNRHGIDLIIGKENLVWAPNRIIGQHNIAALENVVNLLK